LSPQSRRVFPFPSSARSSFCLIRGAPSFSFFPSLFEQPWPLLLLFYRSFEFLREYRDLSFSSPSLVWAHMFPFVGSASNFLFTPFIAKGRKIVFPLPPIVEFKAGNFLSPPQRVWPSWSFPFICLTISRRRSFLDETAVLCPRIFPFPPLLPIEEVEIDPSFFFRSSTLLRLPFPLPL